MFTELKELKETAVLLKYLKDESVSKFKNILHVCAASHQIQDPTVF